MTQPPTDSKDPRSSSDRVKSRYEGLRVLGCQIPPVLQSLAAEHAEGGFAPERILIRRTFARRAQPYIGAVSDRRLPPPAERPPSVRIVRPNGVAHPFVLTALFVAQCRTKPGYAFVNEMATFPEAETGQTRTWADLIAVPLNKKAQARTGGPRRGKRILEDNRRRQIHGAVRTLADGGQRLLHQPNAASSSRRYEDFMLLDETGVVDKASLRRYHVPDKAAAVFSLPAAFFLNGWHQVLTPSEVNFLLMLYASVGSRDAFPAEHRKIDSEERLRTYALSPGAYGSHMLLREFGLVDVVYPDGRDPADGTFAGFNEGEQPELHSFRILEAGFDRQALGVVLPSLKSHF
ncbi:hypothetical protein P5P86_19560 [Nocardioides sp. BP30]|uniref:hypothetical protein n=1 Tax=Nocardioides sp. BP30 TaxID=3036374 RepID=UPI002468C411|nr:hypothetical protein [Nocardioides sp. BP30]WGL52136.1 hypothetical protein P5P86_19560 [Nocardioides sp. BP30]